MSREEMAAGFAAGRSLIQEEWANSQEIAWVDELIAEGKATATAWEYHPNYQCERRRVTGATQLASGRGHDWDPPAEQDRKEGYRCIALVELEWAKGFSGKFSWQHPEEHAMMMIEVDAPGVHGFLPLPETPAARSSGGDNDRR